jgi:hypothetical protein
MYSDNLHVTVKMAVKDVHVFGKMTIAKVFGKIYHNIVQ